MQCDRSDLQDRDRALAAEWLLADGAGGYASSTALLCPTRRYHGLWVPALRPPLDRRVVLSHVDERFVAASGEAWLSTTEYAAGFYPDGSLLAERFDLAPFPRLASRAPGAVVDRYVALLEGGQGVCVTYEVRSEAEWALDLAPMLALRPMHHLGRKHDRFRVEPAEGGCGWRILTPDMPAVFCWIEGARVQADLRPTWYEGVLVRAERERGFDFQEDLLAPGRWTVGGRGRGGCRLFCSFNPPSGARAKAAGDGGSPLGPRQGRAVGDRRIETLRRAADAFLVRRRVAGEDLLTVIAGYHWFGDWGRDAMIALPGLAIETGRLDAAARVLECFAVAAGEGMVPNCFDEASGRPEYNSVDASLWFLQALADFAEAGGDAALVRERLWPVALDICDRYARGTRFGIHADSDGLIVAGSEDTQLTWMDARVGGRPVTPRFGRPVEVSALWISGLGRMRDVAARLGLVSPPAADLTRRARAAFKAAFWNPAAGCLYDCLYPDGRADASIRPNQVLAVGLPHAPLSGEPARAVVRTVRERLLTPRGLRTLAPDDPAYRGRYEGGPAERDAAYHQGTAWPWLLGPYADAVLKVERAECARGECVQLLEGLLDALEAGLGQIAEIFDGDPPHRPRGCIAQAWSVAAALHLWRLVGGKPYKCRYI